MPERGDARHGLGVVVIGRNEGRRLERCLASLEGFEGPVVYVDSGSSDRSVEVARSAGVAVHELSSDEPFSAARARNEGVQVLLRDQGDLRFVQFVDGDCEMDGSWLEEVPGLLEAEPRIAAIAGHVREREREQSLARRLCDMEWSHPPGDSPHCGGVFACRLDLFNAVGGFDPAVTAGEEPELCSRLLARGGRVVRVDRPMALHDSGMTRLGQWWKRAVRGGAAQMHNARRLGDSAAWRDSASAAAWGVAAPAAFLVGLVAALWWPPALLLSLLVLAAVAAQYWRIARRRRRSGDPPRDARLYAAFCLLGKVAQSQGAVVALAGGDDGPPVKAGQATAGGSVESGALGNPEA